MRQLTAMDASFLYAEAGGNVGHTSSLILVDPSTADRPLTAATIREFIASRIHLIPPLQWRLVEVPFGIDLPYWVDDPELDLDFHVHESGLPRPGTDEQLTDLLARLASRPLDRSRPLWEIYVIDGLQSGNIGIFTKMHHAAVDGKSGMQVLATLLDFEASGREIPPAPERSGERVPSDAEMTGRAWLNVLSRPEAGLRLATNLARESVGMSRMFTLGGDSPALSTMTRTAPKTVFNRQLSKYRNCAFATLSLTTVREIKSALGCTVNDVILAICTGALRRWLLEHDELPQESLLAMVPISIRGTKAAAAMGNQVSAAAAELATHAADPLEWVRVARESMNAGKALNEAVPAQLLQEFGQFTAPAAAEFVARTFANLKIVNRISMPFNVVVSNVPGPRETLYYAGAQMVGIFPVSMISDGVGLNITILSYRDDLDFGLISTPEIVPDIWTMMGYFEDSLHDIAEAAGIGSAPAGSSTAIASAVTADPTSTTSTGRTVAKRTAAKRSPSRKPSAKKTATVKRGSAKKASAAGASTAKKTATDTSKAASTKAASKKATTKKTGADASKAASTKAASRKATTKKTADGTGGPAKKAAAKKPTRKSTASSTATRRRSDRTAEPTTPE